MRRPSFKIYFMRIAHIVAQRSTCCDKQVGCVLVDKDNHIVACGYNGSLPKAPHCIDSGHCMKAENGYCVATHAERNALNHCHGAPYACYCTLEPCENCAAALRSAGVESVYFSKRTSKEKTGEQVFQGTWEYIPMPEIPAIVDKIREYHIALGYPPMATISETITGGQQARARDLCLATIDEVTEILHSFDWKPWKNYNGVPKMNADNFLEEIGDVIFFLDSLLMNFGFSWEDCLRRIDVKVQENYRRIKTGYHN